MRNRFEKVSHLLMYYRDSLVFMILRVCKEWYRVFSCLKDSYDERRNERMLRFYLRSMGKSNFWSLFYCFCVFGGRSVVPMGSHVWTFVYCLLV